MKVLLLALLFGLAAARTVSDVDPVVYNVVSAAQDAFYNTDKLYRVVDLPECASELNAAESKMKTELGRILKEALEKIVNAYKDRVSKVKNVVQEVKDKVSELREKLRELGEDASTKSKEAVEMVKTRVQDIIDTILNNIRSKKDNLDNQMDEVSKMKLKDLIKQLRERVVERVRDIREYVKDIVVDNEAIRQLKALLNKIDDTELGNLLNNLLDLSGHQLRHLKEMYNKLTELAGKTDDTLKKKIYDLTHWVQTTWHDGLENVVEKYQNIKSSLLEVIADTKDFSVNAVREALKHLEKYREDLGGLYEKLVDSLEKAIGRF